MDNGESHYERKRTELHTKWTEQPHVEHTSPQRKRDHQIPHTSSWLNTDHNQKRGNPRDHEEAKNTFEKRADELSSQVLPASDYTEHVPKSKAQVIDEEVAKRKADRTYSDLFGQTGSRPRTPRENTSTAVNTHWTSSEAQAKGWREGDSAHERHLAHMASELDKRVDAHPAGKDDDSGHRLHGVDARTTRLQELEATALDRAGVYKKFERLDRNGDFRDVVDLKLEGLPSSANSEDLKHIAGVKHVIDATTEDDTITNSCIGKGEIKVRLGEGETKEQLV